MEFVTVTGNTASKGGGLFCGNNSNPTLNNVTIEGNQADSRGGGIYMDNSSPTLTNVTVVGNEALIVAPVFSILVKPNIFILAPIIQYINSIIANP